MVYGTIQESNTGQYTLTVPKQLALAMGIQKGTRVQWRVTGAGKLEIALQ